MQLCNSSHAWFIWLICLLFVLAACSPTPLPSPTAESLPTTLPVSPAVTSAGTTTQTPVSSPTFEVPTNTTTPTNHPQEACPPTQEMEIDPAAILELGPGPGISPTGAKGEKLVISGSVYAEDCTPLAGAMMNVWQTDANGEYGPGHGTDDMRCCYLMGSLRTDARGRYQLITVKPAHYKGEQRPPPAHIHVEISHARAGQLQTEIVFAGDPYLPRVLQNYVVVSLETVPASEGATAYQRGIADIVLDRPGN